MSTSIFSKALINIIAGLMTDNRNIENGENYIVQISEFTMKISSPKFKGTSIERYFIQLLLKKRRFEKGSNSAIQKSLFCVVKAACIICLH